MTTNSIILISRRFLQDTNTPYRWTDSELKQNIQLAIRELNRIRPETRYVNGELTDGIVLPLENDAPIVIDERFEEMLAYYVTYLAYLNDSSDTVNAQLAESYHVKFVAEAQL